MSLGQILNQLVATIPQLIMVQYMFKLVLNDLVHIVVEPVKSEVVTDEKIVESVRRYNREYGSPASWADIVFDMAPEPLKRMVDKWWNSDDGKRVQEEVLVRLDRLVNEGRLVKKDGGYVSG